MSAPVTIEELRSRSNQANDLIQKLQHQIEQIKLQTSPEYLTKRAAELKVENEQLRKEVERLVKELETAEANKASGAPLVNLTNTGSDNKPTAAAPTKVEQPTKQQQQQQQQPKEPKQKQQQQPPKPKEEKKKEELPTDINVSCLDFRVGKIVKCEKHPDADSLYVEQIDFGEGGKLRNVCSGLVKFVSLEQMQNRMIVGLCNLKPTKLRGVLSEAMVMCASTPDKVEILDVPAGAVPGDRVTVAGFEGTPVSELNQKNNIFGIVAPDLNVNGSLVATYKGVPMEIKGKGPIKSASLTNVPVK
jgi:aminoacyl tRNA synthase complex-interacting multifunctional protein 1